VSQMGAITQLPEAAGRASSVFGFIQITFASLLGYVVGRFYDGTMLPTATGVLLAALISLSGFLLVRATARNDSCHEKGSCDE